MKTYKVEYYNSFSEPYWNKAIDTKNITHRTVDVYENMSLDVCIDVIKDSLDAPDVAITEEFINKEFARNGQILSNKVIARIKRYYDYRVDLFKKIKSELSKPDFSYFKESIPEDANSFAVDEDDSDFMNTKQLEAYIEVKVENLEGIQ